MKTLGAVGHCAFVGLWVALSTAAAWAEEVTQPAPDAVAAKSPPLCRCEGDLGSSVARIRQVLAQPLKSSGLDFTEEPLENVFNFLQDEYGIPIQIDEPALEDAGLTRDEPLTVGLREISLQSALRLMLKTKQLTYIIRDEVMIITTPNEAESELIACVYDVRDLIGRNQGNKNLHALRDTITSCVACETWAVNKGGEAEIRALQPGILVVSQTQAVHEDIGKLLALIRETVQQPNRGAIVEEAGMMGGRGRGGFGFGRGGFGMEEGGMGRGGEGGRGGYGGRGGGFGMEGAPGMEGGMGRGGEGGRGGYGGAVGGRGGDGGSAGEMGMEGESEPTPAGDDDPFGP
jgi:hypothetical protein